MNILYLTGTLNVGGTEIYTLTLAKAMKQRGHKIFWATVKEGTIKAEVERQGIALKYCNLQTRTLWNYVGAILKLKKIVKQEKIDIIHANDAYSALVMAYAFASIKKRPHLIWSNVGIGEKSFVLMKKLCESKLDLVIAASQFIKNNMTNVKFDANKIVVQYGPRELNPIHTYKEKSRAELGIDENDFVIGSIGRIVYMKGNHILIQVMAKLLIDYPHLKLVLVGEGEEVFKLKEMASELGISENIIFTGNRTDIENMYSIFDVVAFPTLNEALGYIPMEAMFYKKPIVASDTGGIPEIVHDNYNGILVQTGKVDAWEIALRRIIEDKLLYNRLVHNGTEFYNEYLKPEIIYDRFDNIYKRVRKS